MLEYDSTKGLGTSVSPTDDKYPPQYVTSVAHILWFTLVHLLSLLGSYPVTYPLFPYFYVLIISFHIYASHPYVLGL